MRLAARIIIYSSASGHQPPGDLAIGCQNMYVCDSCKKQIAPSIPSRLVPVKTRTKQYPKRYDKGGSLVDKGGDGFETVSEIRVCPECHGKMENS